MIIFFHFPKYVSLGRFRLKERAVKGAGLRLSWQIHSRLSSLAKGVAQQIPLAVGRYTALVRPATADGWSVLAPYFIADTLSCASLRSIPAIPSELPSFVLSAKLRVLAHIVKNTPPATIPPINAPAWPSMNNEADLNCIGGVPSSTSSW